MLRVSGLSKSYGHRLALEGVTFSIRSGEVLGLIGPNALWEFHNGIRRPVRFSDRAHKFMLDRAKWHELKMSVDGAAFTAWLDGEKALEYTLGSAPGPGRNGASPHPDLFPAANPVLQPPVKGRVGLWSKTDSTSEFKDYVVATRPE